MYSPSERKKIKNRFTLCLFLFVFDLVLLLATVIVSLCLTNYRNYLYFEIIGGILVAVLTFFAIFLFCLLKDARRYLLHFDSVIAEKEKRIEAEVVSVGTKTLTLDDNIRVNEIALKQGEDARVYYLLSAFFPCPIEEGHTYVFALADHFIKGVEDEL